MSERSNNKLEALSSPTVPFHEPRPIHSAEIEPDVTRPHVTPHIELTNKVSAEPEAKPEGTPTIQVTIGRVEVRAITPPATPAPRTRPARPGPALSLDDYLRERNRGER